MAIDDSTSERLSECGSLLAQEKTDLLSLKEAPILYQTKQLKYLADSYNRSLNEEKNYSKVSLKTNNYYNYKACASFH